jgi:hypothetical protein
VVVVIMFMSPIWVSVLLAVTSSGFVPRPNAHQGRVCPPFPA